MALSFELVSVKNKVLFPRSGHKLLADEKYIYVLGGYVERNTLADNHLVKGEVWRFHHIYKIWEKCLFDKDIFTYGASHSAIRVGHCAFITGGTGYPFGVNILNSLIVINLKEMTQQSFQFKRKHNLGRNLPIATYGHSMTYVYMDKNPYIFIVGGTTGDTYHQEVYQINLITLESELVSDSETKDAPKPRYKHETFFYRDHLYVLGGATGNEFCFDLNIIHKFNVYTRTWTQCEAVDKINMKLRCPAMCQNDRYVYVSGGHPTYDNISDAVFEFDLQELRWCKICTWQTPSYFHDSVYVPQLASVFVFGGVHRIQPSHKRNNDLYVYQPNTGLISQSLIERAWAAVVRCHLAALESLVKRDDAGDSGGDSSVSKYLASLGVPRAILARATTHSPVGDSNAA